MVNIASPSTVYNASYKSYKAYIHNDVQKVISCWISYNCNTW